MGVAVPGRPRGKLPGHERLPVVTFDTQMPLNRRRYAVHIRKTLTTFCPPKCPRNDLHLALTGQTSGVRARIRSSLLACLWPSTQRCAAPGISRNCVYWICLDVGRSNAAHRARACKGSHHQIPSLPRHSSPQVKVQQKPAQTSKAEPGRAKRSHRHSQANAPVAPAGAAVRRRRRFYSEPIPTHRNSR